jgi:hypothetical protein
MHAMRNGDFAAAWRVCDRVLAARNLRGERCDTAPRHQQFVWRGQPLARRRVLVRCYHGLGDTLQFVRFAAPLRREARETLFWVQPPLLKLVADVPGVDRVLPLHDGTPEADYDADIEIMELAHALRISNETLGSFVPYVAREAMAKHATGISHRATARRRRIGIAWSAGTWNPRRSLPHACVARLRAAPDIEWFSLQFGACPRMWDMPSLACEDVAALAGQMATLDLVISVDTMVAHLAGAMGMPVLTLLPTPCDWRWMIGREDSPWYPTMRLLRQPEPGDWSGVVDRVLALLGARAGS